MQPNSGPNSELLLSARKSHTSKFWSKSEVVFERRFRPENHIPPNSGPNPQLCLSADLGQNIDYFEMLSDAKLWPKSEVVCKRRFRPENHTLRNYGPRQNEAAKEHNTAKKQLPTIDSPASLN